MLEIKYIYLPVALPCYFFANTNLTKTRSALSWKSPEILESTCKKQGLAPHLGTTLVIFLAIFLRYAKLGCRMDTIISCTISYPVLYPVRYNGGGATGAEVKVRRRKQTPALQSNSPTHLCCGVFVCLFVFPKWSLAGCYIHNGYNYQSIVLGLLGAVGGTKYFSLMKDKIFPEQFHVAMLSISGT